MVGYGANWRFYGTIPWLWHELPVGTASLSTTSLRWQARGVHWLVRTLLTEVVLKQQLSKTQIANRRTWANALCESRQFTGALADGHGRYCCLGVLCKVLAHVPDRSMKTACWPELVSVNYKSLVGRRPGLVDCEEAELAVANDAGEPHPSIALYLYLTSEAKEVLV